MESNAKSRCVILKFERPEERVYREMKRREWKGFLVAAISCAAVWSLVAWAIASRM